ncbi:hypothetical protein EBU91_04915 [bacterium]|nr:hypothetical protein [bacterium]
MLKLINNIFHALVFYLGVKVTRFKAFLFERTGQHHKVKATKLALKEGESYRLGECIVTLAKFGIEGKQQVAEKIKAIEAIRALREADLTQRAEKIMLMSPAELEQFKVNEWLDKVQNKNEQKIYESIPEKEYVAIKTKRRTR